MSTEFAHFDLHNPEGHTLQIAFRNNGDLYLPDTDPATLTAAGNDGIYVCVPNNVSATDNFVLYPAQWLLQLQGQSALEAKTGVDAFLSSIPVCELVAKLEDECFFTARNDMQGYIESQAQTHMRMADIISSALTIQTTTDDELLAVNSIQNLAELLCQFSEARQHHGIAEEVIKVLLDHTEVLMGGIASGSIVIEYGRGGL